MGQGRHREHVNKRKLVVHVGGGGGSDERGRRKSILSHLDAVARREALLDGLREKRNLRRPRGGVVLLEALEQRLEHLVQLRRRLVPSHDRVAEPQQALR